MTVLPLCSTARVLARLAAACLAFPAMQACAAAVSVQVNDAADKPLADAVVYAEPVGQPAPKVHRTFEIEQKGRKFLPLVSVVQTGTDISFPNNDSVRHHVYSLSPAKPFELKLYSGVPGKPVTFDKPGTVILGCNIHDQMVAYIQVVDTPWFGRTDASGKAHLEGLPAGRYQLKAWHYGLPPGAPAAEQALTVAAADATAVFRLAAKH